MTRKLWYLSLGCATCALVAGYGNGGLWIWTVPILGLAGLWLLGQQRGLKWVASLELLLYVALAVIGLWQKLSTGLMLLGMIAALTTWDIECFHQRMDSVERVDHKQDLERKYLQRLLITEGLGALLAVAAMSLNVGLSFGSALLLGLIAVFGLSRTIGFLRRESD